MVYPTALRGLRLDLSSGPHHSHPSPDTDSASTTLSQVILCHPASHPLLRHESAGFDDGNFVSALPTADLRRPCRLAALGCLCLQPCWGLGRDTAMRPAFHQLEPSTLGLTVTLHALPWGAKLAPCPYLEPCQCEASTTSGSLAWAALDGFNKMIFALSQSSPSPVSASVVFYENSGLVGFCAGSWVRATMDLRISFFSFGFVYFVH